MTMDGLNLFAASREIAWLAGGKIEKIHQPEKDELVLAVRAGGNHYRLLLSANPSHARAQLTGSKRANPLDAPAFCMLLRRRDRRRPGPFRDPTPYGPGAGDHHRGAK